MHVLFIISSLSVSYLCYGHARLSVVGTGGAIPRLIPRNALDSNKGDATAPCGSGSMTRSTNPVVLTVGESVSVDYEETISHTGNFLLSFSQMGQVNFNQLAPSQVDDNTPLGAGPNKGRFTFTVPNTPCTDCTIQFAQDMGGTLHYKSCVDIIITPLNAPAPAQPTGFAVSK